MRSLFLLIGLIIFSNNAFSSSLDKTNYIVIDDFESYNINDSLAEQANWYYHSNEITCGPVIKNNNTMGNYVQSSSCYDGQSVIRNYNFRFAPNMKNCFIQFSGLITNGNGNNCSTEMYISSSSGKGSFKFGVENVTHLNIDHQLVVNDNYGIKISPGEWYDFRFEFNLIKNEKDKYGTGTLKYKLISSTEWITDSQLSNIILNIDDPSSLDKITIRMDGLSQRLGVLDDILVKYDDTVQNSILGKIVTSSQVLGYTASVGGATIKAMPYNLSTVTDIYGNYQIINIPEGECIFQIESSYFQTLTKTIQVNIGDNHINTIEIFKPKCQNMYTKQEVDQLLDKVQYEKDAIISEKEATITQLNTSIATMYTQGYLDKAIAEAEKRGELKYDINNDGKVGLEEVIKYLETISGVHVESLIIFPEKRKYFLSE